MTWRTKLPSSAPCYLAIMTEIEKGPPEGMACHEIEELTGRPHQQVSANLTRLGNKGVVIPSGVTSRTRSGSKAKKWVIEPSLRT